MASGAEICAREGHSNQRTWVDKPGGGQQEACDRCGSPTGNTR